MYFLYKGTIESTCENFSCQRERVTADHCRRLQRGPSPVFDLSQILTRRAQGYDDDDLFFVLAETTIYIYYTSLYTHLGTPYIPIWVRKATI